MANLLSTSGNHPGTLANSTPTWTGAAVNGPVVDGKRISVMLCPSSPVEAVRSSGYGRTITCPQDTGIAGAASDPAGSGGFTNSAGREWSNSGQGIFATGGVLIPLQTVNFAKITDGSTNQIVVSEQSGVGRDANNNSVTINNHQGFLCSMIDTACPGCNQQIFNLTTIRYPPNFTTTTLNGIRNNEGWNNGIFSSHEGGVHTLMGDGSVRFLGENTDMTTIKRLATRDDGVPIGDF